MLNQNYNKRVVMNTSYTEPISSPCSGVERLLLERSEDSEYAISTTLVTFHEDAKFDEHQHDGGEELFVLEGTFSDEFGDYPTGTYIRNPRKSKHSPYSVNGCKLFVKLLVFLLSSFTSKISNFPSSLFSRFDNSFSLTSSK